MASNIEMEAGAAVGVASAARVRAPRIVVGAVGKRLRRLGPCTTHPAVPRSWLTAVAARSASRARARDDYAVGSLTFHVGVRRCLGCCRCGRGIASNLSIVALSNDCSGDNYCTRRLEAFRSHAVRHTVCAVRPNHQLHKNLPWRELLRNTGRKWRMCSPHSYCHC